MRDMQGCGRRYFHEEGEGGEIRVCSIFFALRSEDGDENGAHFIILERRSGRFIRAGRSLGSPEEPTKQFLLINTAQKPLSKS